MRIRTCLAMAAVLIAVFAAPSAAQSTPASVAAKPGEGAWANYDFIPGERILFADDFSADRVGNFPQRLELIVGNMEVVDSMGIRYVRATSNSKFAVNLPEALPQRFTMEFDIALAWHGMIVYAGPEGTTTDADFDYSAHQHSFILISGTAAGLRNAGGRGGSSVNPRAVTDFNEDIPGHLYRIRVHGDGRYIKVYMDEHRIANTPNADFLRTHRMIFEMTGGGGDDAMMIGNISINAGGRDMYDALQADGRFVTQGIFFDVASDRMRPESSPTLKMMGDMLKDHAELKLTVEGHTDNTGDASSNQTLSEKRAHAIVAYVTTTYSISPDRLQARGIGASRPAKPNDTPEGKQQNRRVELVKM